MSEALYGRERALTALSACMDGGEVVVLYGPVGVGKSALLRALERLMGRRGRPCALAPRTSSLGDLTDALGRAYPSVAREESRRRYRGRLRWAVENRPGVLLLDALGYTGTAFKGAIKSVRGTGIGIVLAADVDTPRDHDRIRELGLTHREMELPALHASSTRALLLSLLEGRALPFALRPEHLRRLVAATDGLPGRAAEFADALAAPTSWRDGEPRIDWLRTSAVIRAAERYRRVLRTAGSSERPRGG